MFVFNGAADDVSEARHLPLYEKLSADCEIEGRVCRGEDRIEVRPSVLCDLGTFDSKKFLMTHFYLNNPSVLDSSPSSTFGQSWVRIQLKVGPKSIC